MGCGVDVGSGVGVGGVDGDGVVVVLLVVWMVMMDYCGFFSILCAVCRVYFRLF